MATINTIYDSAYKGDFDSVKTQLEENPHFLILCDNNGRLLIHWAAMSGNMKLMNYLLEKESPTDPLDETEVTPLILAASAGKGAVCDLLIERGVNLNSRNNQGHSALQYACSKGWLDIAESLLNKKANVNISDIRGATPLHRAASIGNTAIVKLLLDHNDININARDIYGNTPLHLACEEDRQEEAKMLLKHGADIEIRNKEQKTALDLCSFSLKKLLNNLIKQEQ